MIPEKCENTRVKLLFMLTISADQMLQDAAKFLGLVEGGETLVITRDNEPIAELKPVEAETRPPRVFGSMAGQFVVPDDFDAPLPDDILDAFEGR